MHQYQVLPASSMMDTIHTFGLVWACAIIAVVAWVTLIRR